MEGRSLALPCSCRWEVEVARLAWPSVSRLAKIGFQAGIGRGPR